MNKFNQFIASGVACCAAFSQAAFAGVSGAYSVDPAVEDSGSDAGLALLVAVGVLLVIKAIAKPKRTPPTDGASGTTE